jgi:multiple sugar transport system substrate-binding protein
LTTLPAPALEPRSAGAALPVSGRAALWVLFAVCLMGCRPADSGAVRITGWLASPVEERLTEALVREFRARHPSIPVHYEPITANYMDKLLLMLGTHTAPDIFMLEAFWVPTLAPSGLLQPLNDAAAGANDFEPILREALCADGRLYALPKDWSTLVLFYNPRMLDEAGLAGPPRTWEAFADAAARLTRDTDGDGRVDRYGYVHAEALEYSLPFAWQNGGDFVDIQGRAAFGAPAFVEALDFLQGLKTQGSAALPSDVGASWNMDAFGRQRAAMAVSGLWAVNFLRETFPAVPFRVAPLPAGRRAATVVFVVGYALSAESRHPEQARQLLAFLTSPEGERLWAEAGVGLPPRRALAEAPGLRRDALRQVFIDSLAEARPWRFPVGQRVLDETQAALQAIFLTSAPVRPILEALRRRLESARLLPVGPPSTPSVPAAPQPPCPHVHP